MSRDSVRSVHALDALDSSVGGVTDRGKRRLRAALAAQRDRALIFVLSAVAIVLANMAGVMYVHLRFGLAVLAMALASTLVVSYLARRSYSRHRRVNFAGWWIACDVVIITAMVPWTGGVMSPVWIWYLACAGMAVMHRGRPFALAGAAMTAVLYLGVLFADGSIVGFDKTLFLPLSRLVFLGCASLGLLHNMLRLRATKQVVRQLKEEADVRAAEHLRDNERLEAMAGLLRDQSLTDPLTGLRNRRYLTERIADVAKRRDGRPGQERRAHSGGLGSGFLVLDLDNFKPINDTHGHAAGDAALQHVAAVLGECSRSDDTVARLGGDEFVVFLPQVDAAGVQVVAEKVAAAMLARPARLSATTEVVLSFSIGCSFVDPNERFAGTEAFDNALAAADWALYQAKQEGRNCIRGIEGIAPALAGGLASLPAQAHGQLKPGQTLGGAAGSWALVSPQWLVGKQRLVGAQNLLEAGPVVGPDPTPQLVLPEIRRGEMPGKLCRLPERVHEGGGGESPRQVVQEPVEELRCGGSHS